MAAFAIQLSGALSDDQVARIRVYAMQSCNEHRILAKPTCVIFAGVLRRPFATKKAAQNSFNLNLKSWKIDKNVYSRGWFRELSVDDYMKEFRDVNGIVGKHMHSLVWGMLNKSNDVALQHITKALAEEEKLEKENLEREIAAKTADAIAKRRAALIALDPAGYNEKNRVSRECCAMSAESRWAERIRYADSLPPPKKPRLHIFDCPRPRKYIEDIVFRF